jgi:hypothetical protein
MTMPAQMSLEDTGIALQDQAAERVRWFSARGCVVWSEDGERAEVFVGGELVGSFGRRGETVGMRNALMVQLSEARDMHLGRLARAFDMSEEGLRKIRRLYESEGVEAVVARRLKGGKPTLSARQIAHAEKMFERGARVRDVRAHLKKRGKVVSSQTVGAVRARWLQRKGATAVPVRSPSAPSSAEHEHEHEHEREPELSGLELDADAGGREAAVIESADAAADHDTDEVDGGDRGDDGGPAPIVAPVQSGRSVQHAGSWMLLAMTSAAGLFTACEQERAREDRDGPRPRPTTLRLALEALVVALAIGQRCVEGVRRIATPTSGLLLRASRAPSASWVRRVLGALAVDAGGVRVLLRLAGEAMRRATTAAATAGHPTVFYADNHLRRYTGKHTVRRGWRMQDRRVVPGITDCYLHDQDGRAVLRIDSPEHEHLTTLLGRLVSLIRAALGDEERVLLAFDRAGAFPEQLAELRERGVQFVTYERRPYPLRAATAFTETLDLGDGETLRWVEDARKNLRGGRGRVRRIAVLDDEGRQINLVAVSDQSAPWLIGVMRGRWKQENAFKHGGERWGHDQLDTRTVEHYPPETVIPNPARRRLDHALRLARVREGDARRELARLPSDDSRRERLERDIREAIALQEELEAQRPRTPDHAPLEETELAGKLVRHTAEMKLLVDAVRIASANAESELAAHIGPHMTRPAEAKKLLANVFAAPGDIRVGPRTITVSLSIAANAAERTALDALFEELNELGLTLPGDDRELRFESQLSPD